jgi:hypothetical protein
MRALMIAATCLLLLLGSAAAQPAGKPVYPKKMGIYAMTPQGPVELKVSGERADVELTNGLKCFYSADSFDRIPKAELVQSFYVSAMGWVPRGLYLVVGRDGLVNSQDRYQRFTERMVLRGAVAFEVFSVDLQSPGFILRAIRKLAPAGLADSEIEAYLVLELKSTSGLNDRSYPIRISVPHQ